MSSHSTGYHVVICIWKSSQCYFWDRQTTANEINTEGTEKFGCIYEVGKTIPYGRWKQMDKWQHAKMKFWGCSHRWTSKRWTAVLCTTGFRVAEGWGMFQNTRWNPCLWRQEAVVLWRSWELILWWRHKGWSRGTAGSGVCVGSGVQTLQRNLLVSLEVPLTRHLSQHQFGGQCNKPNVSLWLGSVAAKTFYCNANFAVWRGFFFQFK